MANRRYLNFDLLLEAEGDGEYQARVIASPLADLPHVRFRLPYDATTLENLLLKLDPGRSRVRGPGLAVQEQAARDFGGPLYQVIFTGDLSVAWSRSIDRARSLGADGLRLRLRIDDAPGLVGLPWELLYDAKGRTFLAQSERTPLVRFLDVAGEPQPMHVDGPLRALVIISSPLGLEELDVEREWARIRSSLAAKVDEGLVVVDRLPEATVAELGRWLLHHETHVIHFVGHGDFDSSSGDGFIFFQDERGQQDAVDADILGPFVHDHDPLRLLVINACRSARADMSDPYGGLAQGLVLRGAMAVIAMQFPISDNAAVKFTGDFYGALAAGLPVDQAMGYARKTLHARFSAEWATPVLFMRSPDGNIFENVHAGVHGVGPDTQPDTDPTEPDTGPDVVAGDSETPLASRRLRQHPRLLAAALAGLLLLIALAVPPVLRQLSGGDPPGRTSSDEEPPTPGFGPDLPQSPPLTDGQMLVAAGDKWYAQRVWLLDLDHGENSKPISTGPLDDRDPVLSPDRRSMIFRRLKPSTEDEYELWVAAALTGQDERPLFDVVPSECATDMGRPAWAIPDGPDSQFLVMRCRDAQGVTSLVRVDVDGDVQTLDVVGPNSQPWASFGEPTVSPDGSMVALWVSDDADALEGKRVYAITLVDRKSHELSVGLGGGPDRYGDPVFSPRSNVLKLAYTIDYYDGGMDIWVATLRGPATFEQSRVTDNKSFEMMHSLTFSQDGSEIAYLSEFSPGADTTMVRVPVDRKSKPQGVRTVAAYQSGPSWSVH